MDVLGKLFGSPERIKVLRLFLNNPEESFALSDISLRTRVPSRRATKEVELLAQIGFLEHKTVTRKIEKRKKTKTEKRKEFSLNQQFPHNGPLRSILFNSQPAGEELINWFRNAGRIKLLVVSGAFLQEPESRLDILIVGDNLKRPVVERSLRNIEAEIGRELSYGVMTTEEFRYRLSIYDKFVRDVLDYPHRVLVDRLGVGALN